jgi:uncharacterized membrane protein YphA (DoxX/SURF4 family)
MKIGGRVLGLGVMALGLLGLAWGDFVSGQSVPKAFPDRAVLAYAAGALMLVAGAAVEGRRTAAWGAAALTAYFGLVVLILMDGPALLAHPAQYGPYENIAESLAITSGALIVWAGAASIDAALAARLTRVGQVAFALCSVVFGGAHFAYLQYTAALVPKWLPPSQMVWTYATAVGHIAAGLAILTGIRARLAAILATVMYAAFQLLVHLPMLLAGHPSRFVWAENATNLALTGAVWVVADSLARTRR